MRILHTLWFFNKKILLLSFVISPLLPLLSIWPISYTTAVGTAFMFVLPLVHYLNYELHIPAEYYFYFNLGLTKKILWINTVLISVIIGTLIIML